MILYYLPTRNIWKSRPICPFPFVLNIWLSFHCTCIISKMDRITSNANFFENIPANHFLIFIFVVVLPVNCEEVDKKKKEKTPNNTQERGHPSWSENDFLTLVLKFIYSSRSISFIIITYFIYVHFPIQTGAGCESQEPWQSEIWSNQMARLLFHCSTPRSLKWGSKFYSLFPFHPSFSIWQSNCRLLYLSSVSSLAYLF